MRAAAALLAVLVTGGCHATMDSLGYNAGTASGGIGGPTVAGAGGAAGAGIAGAGIGGAAGVGGATPPPPETLHPVTGPASYPNPLHDVLGQTTNAISQKIQTVFNQLFKGDPSSQAIYYTVGSDQGYVLDVLHNQVRTEGQGLGMMIAVELNQRPIFDNLWRYAKAKLQVMDGPTAGYFNSFCDSADQMTNSACLDPFGFEQFVTALIFAHDRWGSTGAVNYQADALALYHSMRGTAGPGADAAAGTPAFDATTNLPFAQPDPSPAAQTRPSVVTPGYYVVWAQAFADTTFTTSASSGRTFLIAASHPSSGLTAARTNFAGVPVSGWAVFNPEAYRTQINMVIDESWTGGSTYAAVLNRLLAFFTAQGFSMYGTSYTWDGATEINMAHETSLVVANAVAAGASSNMDRTQYLSALWNMPITTGNSRYFVGIMQLWALLIAGGQFQIY